MSEDELFWLLHDHGFGSVEEARDFIEWYNSHRHSSNWDEARHAAAMSVMQVTAQSAPPTERGVRGDV